MTTDPRDALQAATDDVLDAAETALSWPDHQQAAVTRILADATRKIRAVQHAPTSREELAAARQRGEQSQRDRDAHARQLWQEDLEARRARRHRPLAPSEEGPGQ